MWCVGEFVCIGGADACMQMFWVVIIAIWPWYD